MQFATLQLFTQEGLLIPRKMRTFAVISKNIIMDYTKLPRNLIYRERRSLVEFGVKSNHINSMIFKRMQELPMFRDMVDGDVCALRCFNNAYYICLLILNDDFPRLRIRLYVDLALDKDRWKYSFDAQAMTMGIVYILLKACRIEEGFLQDLYTFFRRFGWDSNGARFSFYNMVDSISLKSYTVYKSEFAPRIVEEGMQSKDFLKDFIALDSELITEYITTVCTHDHQRLLLIRKTIQLEKESYGFLDMRIVQGYHTLYKLQADLTGTPMPERLPCDDVNPWGGPKLSPSSSSPSFPPELQDSSRVIGLQKDVSELRSVNKEQKVEIERLKAEIERLNTEKEGLIDEIKKLKLLDDGFKAEGSSEIMTEEEEFTLRERVVFFATVMSLDIKKKYTVLQNLATFIATLCNDKPHIRRIGTFLSRMQKPEEKAANAKAAKRVGDMMKLILPADYRNDEKLTINKLVESMKNNFPGEEEE